MPDSDLLEGSSGGTGGTGGTGSTATLAARPAAPARPVRTGETPLGRAAGLRDVKNIEASDATAQHHEQIVVDLDRRAMVKARQGVPALLEELGRRGFSWREVARLSGVSVPAVRKWRTGGTFAPERRTDLARLAGLCDLLDEYLVIDPAGWLATPIVKGVPVTWIDLYMAGLAEQVVDGATPNRTSDPHRLLDAFDAGWREKYRTDYEVFEASDGELSIRAKRR
jgi:transcriptional regulator with XRE-family HTH domain